MSKAKLSASKMTIPDQRLYDLLVMRYGVLVMAHALQDSIAAVYRLPLVHATQRLEMLCGERFFETPTLQP